MMPKISYLIAALTFGLLSAPAAEDRDTKVRQDKQTVESLGEWIYNDLPKGFAEAARTGKPLLVVFRCIP